MSAGSNFSGIAQGGVGQGFAQGAQQAIDNYNKKKDQLLAAEQFKYQKNTQILGLLQKNIETLSIEDQIDFDTATADEIRAWSNKQEAKAASMGSLVPQLGKVLKGIGGEEFDADAYVKSVLGVNSTEFATSKMNGAMSARQLSDMKPKLAEAKAVWAQTVNKYGADSKPAQEAKAAYDKIINEADTATGKSFKDLYRTVRGTEYIDPTADPAQFEASGRQTAVNNAFQAQLLSYATQGDKFAEAAVTANLGSNDTIPGTNMTVSQYVKQRIDQTQMTAWAKSGSPADIEKLIGLTYGMSAEERSTLPQDVQTVVNRYDAYINDPRPDAEKEDTLIGQVVANGKLPRLTVAEKEGNIKAQQQQFKYTDLQIRIGEQNLVDGAQDRLIAIGREAREGNYAVNTPAQRALFDAQFDDTVTQEQKDAAWDAAVVQPLKKFEERGKATLDSIYASTTATQLGSLSQKADLITKGGLFVITPTVTNANGETTPDFSSDVYAKFAGANGGDSPLTRKQFEVFWSQSKVGFDALDEAQRTQLLQAQANLSLTQSEVRVSEATETYRTTLSEANSRAAVAGADQSEVEAFIAKATKDARVNGFMAKTFADTAAVLGKDWINSPQAEKMFKAEFGEGWEAAKVFARQQVSYEQQGKSLSVLDQYLKNPRVWMNQPDALSKAAKQAGIEPKQFIAEVKRLGAEGNTLGTLEVERIKTGIWAEKERVALSKNAEAFNQLTTTERMTMDKDQNAFQQWATRQNITLATKSETFQQWISRERLTLDKNGQIFNQSMESQRLTLAKAAQTLAVTSQNAEERRWWTNYNYGLERDKVNDAFRERGVAREELQTQISNAFTLIGLEQNGKSLDINQKAQLANFKTATLPAVQAIQQGANATADNASSQLTALVGNRADLKQLQGQIVLKVDAKGNPVKDANGNYQLENEVLTRDTSQQNFVTQATQLLGTRAEAMLQLQSANSFLAEVVDMATSKGVDPYSLLGDGDYTYTQSGGISIPTGPGGRTTPGASVTALKTLLTQTSAPGGKAIINGMISVLQGNASQFDSDGNLYAPGWCGRFVKASVLSNYNIPADSGVNLNANAVDQFRSLKAAGLSINGGKQITSTAGLADGTLLYQDTPDNPNGHIAIYAGGKIWQNSQYNDNKITGAVGWMEPEAFFKANKTYGAKLPDAWAKNAPKTATAAPAAAPTVKPGTAQTKFTDGNNGFAPSNSFKVAATALVKKGLGRVVGSPTNTGALQVPNNDGKYVSISDRSQANLVLNGIGTQAVMHYDSLRASSGAKGTLRTLAKAEPQTAVEVVSSLLYQAGLRGDLTTAATEWLKSRKYF